LAIYYLVITFIWYFYAGDSVTLDALRHVLLNIKQKALTDVINPTWVQSVVATPASPHVAIRILEITVNRSSQIFIFIGILTPLLRPRATRFQIEYVVFSMLSFPVYLGCLPLPFLHSFFRLPLAGGFDVARLYHITLVFLSPFLVIGVITTLKIISRMVRVSLASSFLKNWPKVLSVYLAILFLFQAGLVWHLTTGSSPSRVLSLQWVRENGTLLEKAQALSILLSAQDVLGAEWLSRYTMLQKNIYAMYVEGKVGSLTSYGMIPYENVPRITEEMEEIDKDAYVYLQYLNVIEGIGTEFDTRQPEGQRVKAYDISKISHLWEIKSKIYSNGGSEIYK
jgi:uncharacterized membrane protein